MKSWNVVLSVDATVTVTVEAETAEEAKDKALDIARRPNLCHQCASDIDVGDVIDALEATEA